MAVDNGDAHFSGFSRWFINRAAGDAQIVDNPMDKRSIALI